MTEHIVPLPKTYRKKGHEQPKEPTVTLRKRCEVEIKDAGEPSTPQKISS